MPLFNGVCGGGAVDEALIPVLSFCGGGAFDEVPEMDVRCDCKACWSSLLVGYLLIVQGAGNNVDADAGFLRSALPLLDVFARMAFTRLALCSCLAVSPTCNDFDSM